MKEFITTFLTACIPAILSTFVSIKSSKSELNKLKEQHLHEIDKLMKQHNIDIESLKEKYRLEAEAKEKEHQRKLEIMQKEHENQLKEQENTAKNTAMISFLSEVAKKPVIDKLIYDEIIKKDKVV